MKLKGTSLLAFREHIKYVLEFILCSVQRCFFWVFNICKVRS